MSANRLDTGLTLTVARNNKNTHEFFKTRKGLWMSREFHNLIPLLDAKVLADETTIACADLVRVANDAEISIELPAGYVFEDVDTFLVYLATLIEGQWDGKEGALLNENGCANIFYVKVNGEVVAVNVYWRDDMQEWFCRADRLGVNRWFVGSRVFSATVA
jgi:hypothetical protein